MKRKSEELIDLLKLYNIDNTVLTNKILYLFGYHKCDGGCCDNGHGICLFCETKL